MNIFNYDPKELRYKRTIDFVKKSIEPPARILDLGTPNELGELLKSQGYEVINTTVDLDKEPEALREYEIEAVTAFEILEHLLNPLGVLENIMADQLFTTIPLRLWFSSAYCNPDDPWDRHFHEFEDWQFDWLLHHSGWNILRKEKWNNPVFKFGIRPVLRLLTPRYYAIEAVKKK